MENWENNHFYTQKKGDMTKPTMCSHCGGKFIPVERGWQCEDCLCLIDGVSFYQGRNSKEKEINEIIEKVQAQMCYCKTLRPEKGDIKECLYCASLNRVKS
jgi:hypothetical protein